MTANSVLVSERELTYFGSKSKNKVEVVYGSPKQVKGMSNDLASIP